MISATQDNSMFSLRRLYLTATTTGKRTAVVVSPGGRAPLSSSHTAAHHPPHLHINHNNPIVDDSNRMLCWVCYYVYSRFDWVVMLVGMIVQFHGYSSSRARTARTNRRHKTHLPKACNDRWHEPYRKNHRKWFCEVVMLKLLKHWNERTASRTSPLLLIFTSRSPISCATFLTTVRLIVPSLYPKMERMDLWPM